MNRSEAAGIRQQMYTRARSGVFRTAEGFDTVAKSDSLDNTFIKKTLHPFCVYDAPAELTARGEKDESRYPAALHLFHAENGDTVIGRSVYVATDFTGLRSAFFTHNFIVPASRTDEIVHKFGEWLHADFAGGYAGEPGGTLPELESVPVRKDWSRPDPLAVLQPLGVDETRFKALLQAAMASVAGKKKMYVTLDVSVEELSERAAGLTEVLFAALPFEYRRRLGVLTYANEPQSRKFIHLTFVEKGALRPGDRATEKDFLFDFAAGRMVNVDFGETNAGYADFAWRMLESGRTEKIADYGRFAEQMLAGGGGERRTDPGFYNELTVFYEIEQGSERRYEDNKSGVLAGLLDFLSVPGALETRIRLNDLFLERFDREFDAIRRQGLPEPEVLESFRRYYLLEGHNYRAKIVDYFINAMLNAAGADRDDLLDTAYGIAEGEPLLAQALFGRLLAQPVFRKRLFEPYVESRLAAAPDAADLVSLIRYWGQLDPAALDEPAVHAHAADYLLEKLRRESDPAAAVSAMREAADKAEKTLRRGSAGYAAAPLIHSLLSAADRYLLYALSLDDMTVEQLFDLGFVRMPAEMAEWHPPLDIEGQRKEKVLRTMFRWFGEEAPDERIFDGLTPQELDMAQLLGRRWLREARSAEPFDRLPLAYYHSSGREEGPLDYEALLDHIRSKAGGNKDTVYRFLAWSQDRPLFAQSRKKLYPGYRRAILKYFERYDREAFKGREFRKAYADPAGPALQAVYTEAKGAAASPLARWMRKNRFPVLISGSLIVIVLILALVLQNLMNSDRQAAAPSASASPVPSAAAEVDAAELYLASGDSGAPELLFRFAGAGDCLAFQPESVTVHGAAGEPQSYAVEAMSACGEAPVPGAADGGGADGDPAASAGAGTASPGATPDAAGGTDAGGDAGGAASAAAGGSADGAGAGDDAAAVTATPGATPDAADGTAGGPGGTAAPEGAGADAPAASPGAAAALPSPGGGVRYDVRVQLAPDAKLAAGDMITADGFTLPLLAGPVPGGAAPVTDLPEAGAAATASPGGADDAGDAGAASPAPSASPAAAE